VGQRARTDKLLAPAHAPWLLISGVCHVLADPAPARRSELGCHVCSNCCRVIRGPITGEERRRILAQGWEDDADTATAARRGLRPWWHRRSGALTARGNGDCVFLSRNTLPHSVRRRRQAPDVPALSVRPGGRLETLSGWSHPATAVPRSQPTRGGRLPATTRPWQAYAAELKRKQGSTPRRSRHRLPVGTTHRLEPTCFRFVQALTGHAAATAGPGGAPLRKCLPLASWCRQARSSRLAAQRLTEFLT